MIDFAEKYYYNMLSQMGDSNDMAIAKNKAFSVVIPIIIENELTERQSICFKYRYIDNKTQKEIADLLKLSQPTVSRHINTAKEIVNSKLKYCYIALTKGFNEYDKLNTVC